MTFSSPPAPSDSWWSSLTWSASASCLSSMLAPTGDVMTGGGLILPDLSSILCSSSCVLSKSNVISPGLSHPKAELARWLPRHLQYLIGDEGFSCSSTLLTIVRSAEVGKITDPEFLTQVKGYNRALKKARVQIEHSFGSLKKRWPALLYKIRSSKIANIQAIISSAVVLHNFLLQDLDPISTIPDDEFERQIAEMRMDNINSLQRGQYRVRNHVIHTFFWWYGRNWTYNCVECCMIKCAYLMFIQLTCHM